MSLEQEQERRRRQEEYLCEEQELRLRREEYLLRYSALPLYILLIIVIVILSSLFAIVGKMRWSDIPEFIQELWDVRQGRISLSRSSAPIYY